MSDLQRELDALLSARGPTGAPLFCVEDLSNMIALVALALGPEGPLANSPAVAVLRAAIEREVPAVLPQAERLEHYFALHPLPDALMTQLARITREHSAAHMSKSARDLIGTSPGLPSNVNAAAPPGTVKAGRLRLAHDDDV